ncbi:MAG: hypothetical protein HFE59_05530 [Clostridiales bacterium]|jgi:hypothetical protein|nr:hypothetical protein [Clostridiales bacterium]
MKQNDFEKILTKFKAASVDGKIDIYTTTEGLNREQYRELLMWFPRTDLDRLEKALG